MWHCNLQHDHSSNYCWNCDINLLTKGKLRVNCQQWNALGMDNVLQTGFHLLLLISTVCTIWLHFWVDKSTEPKTGSNHTCTVQWWISASLLKAWGSLSPAHHIPAIGSQTDTPPRHTIPQTDHSGPGLPSILHFPDLS